MKMPEGFVIDTNSALKATDYTEILNVEGRGKLWGIYVNDVDDLTQNETIKITLDGTVILDAAFDYDNADEFISMVASVLAQAIKTYTASTDAHYNSVSIQNPLYFNRSLKVEYKRAAAGTTGITINIAYSITPTP